MPLQTSRFMEELAKQLPDDALYLRRGADLLAAADALHAARQTGALFPDARRIAGRGYPRRDGLKLAHPDKTVIGFTGDGGSMYTIQALWTAARHNIGAKFVICNNASYMLLKLNIMQYWREQGLPPGKFPDSFDLTGPMVDFVKIAESMGVPGARVERPEQVEPAIQRMLAHDGPFLSGYGGRQRACLTPAAANRQQGNVNYSRQSFLRPPGCFVGGKRCRRLDRQSIPSRCHIGWV